MPTSSTTRDPLRRALSAAVVLLSTLALCLACAPAGAGASERASDAAADAAPDRSGGPVASAAASSRYGRALLAELNRIRAARGLPGLRLDARLSRTAAAHSRDMRRRGYFAHGEWGGRVARAAGNADELGEVIGWLRRGAPAREARGVVRGWLDSPPHRAVLLDARFRRVGVGRAAGRFNGTQAALYTVDWASAR